MCVFLWPKNYENQKAGTTNYINLSSRIELLCKPTEFDKTPNNLLEPCGLTPIWHRTFFINFSGKMDVAVTTVRCMDSQYIRITRLFPAQICKVNPWWGSANSQQRVACLLLVWAISCWPSIRLSVNASRPTHKRNGLKVMIQTDR